jgi:hypothetical protein
MSQQLFDEIADGLSPSTVDVDAVIRKENRRRAAHRATGVMTATVALTGVLTVSWTIGAARAPTPGAVPALSPTAASPSPGSPQDGFRLVDSTREDAAATAKKLSEAMDNGLRHVVPGARWVYVVSNATEVEAGPDGQPPTIEFRDVDWRPVLPSPPDVTYHPRITLRSASPAAGLRMPVYQGGQGVEVHGRKGSLKLEIAFRTPEDDKFGPFVQSRTFLPWPGETVPPMERFVKLKVAGGRILTLTLGNVNGYDIDPAPLTSDQLIAIATEVAGKIQP